MGHLHLADRESIEPFLFYLQSYCQHYYGAFVDSVEFHIPGQEEHQHILASFYTGNENE